MHLFDSCVLQAYRDKILLEHSFYSRKTRDIRFFLLQYRKTNLDFCFLRYLLMILKQKQSVGRRADLQQFEIFLKNSIIIVENLSFRMIFFQLTKGWFKQFNPNKLGKYGLLFKSINASRYPYSFVSVPYCRKLFGEPTKEYKPGTWSNKTHGVKIIMVHYIERPKY